MPGAESGKPPKPGPGLLGLLSGMLMTALDWKTHFGPAWKGLKQAKKKYDPRNVLGAGISAFPACDGDEPDPGGW